MRGSSDIGRDTVRPPAAVLQREEAGAEIRGSLTDARSTLADASGEIHTIFNSLAVASSGGARGSGPMTRSAGGRKRARSRTAECSANKATATATATYIA